MPPRPIFAEPLLVHEIRNLRLGQSGFSMHQDQVKPHTQGGVLLGQSNRLFKGRAVDHQAGASENAFPMSAEDGAVGGGRNPEIISVYD